MATEAEKRGVRGATFYKIEDAEGTLQFSQQFPDLSNDGNEERGAQIRGGSDQRIAMLHGTVPRAPYYGDAQLSNFSILLRNTTVHQGTSAKPPEIIAYKFKDESQGGVLTTTSPSGVLDTSVAVGDVAVVNRNIIVGSTQIQDHFSAVTCDFFTGTQEGWAVDEVTITNQRVSRMAGVGSGLYLSPEDAFDLGYLDKPYLRTGNNHAAWVPGVKYSSNSDSTVALMRQKHGTGYDDTPNPVVGVDKDGNLVAGSRLVKLTQDSQVDWLKTAINLSGKHNDTVYFKESEIASKLVDFGNTILEDDEKYGDEVNTDNSIFSQVRGSGEYFTGEFPEEEDGEVKHNIDRVGVVRYVAENVATKGKCCQLYTYISADGGDSITNDPNYYDPKALDNGHIEVIQDAAAVVGPLPMPMGPIPAAGMGVAEDEWGGNGTANHEQEQKGLYAPMEIKMTFTIPQMSTQSVFTEGSTDYVDIARRGFAIMFSHDRPALNRQRYADFLQESVYGNNGISCGLVFLKGGGSTDAATHAAEHGEAGIFVYDFASMLETSGSLSEPTSKVTKTKSYACRHLTNTPGYFLGPLVEGETYELTITTTASNTSEAADSADDNDDMVATIRTVPTSTNPNGVMINEPSNQTASNYIIMTCTGDVTAPKTFSVVEPDSNSTSGDTYDSDGEVFKYMSIWNNNTPNQNGLTDYIGHSHTDIDHVDIALDNREADMCNIMNIDNIQIGNYNVATLNSSVIEAGQDSHIPSTQKGKSKIKIGSGMSRTRGWKAYSSNFYGEGVVADMEHTPLFSNNIDDTLAGDWHGKIPGYTMLHFGSNNAGDFFNSDRYLFFNGFNCLNLAGNQTQMINDSGDKIYLGGGWYSGDMSQSNGDRMVPLGHQGGVNSAANKHAYYDFGYASVTEVSGGKSDNTYDQSITVASATTVDHGDAHMSEMCVYLDGFGTTTDLGDVAGFTQKGLVKLEAQGTTDLTPNAAKRENGFFSAKILSFDPTTGVAIVDTVEPFKCDIEQVYIAYIMGGAADTNTMYRNDILVEEILSVNSVRLKWSGMANDNSTFLPQTDKLPGLWISPYCYWITLRVLNMSDFETNSYVFDSDYSSTYRPKFDIFTGKWLPSKTYDSVLVVSNTGTLGATFNEYIYENMSTTTRGAVENSWSLEPTKEESMLDLRDFGYGPFTEIEESNHQGFKGGYALKGQPLTGDWFSLSNPTFNEKASAKPGDKLAFLLEPAELDVDHLIYFSATKNSNGSHSYNADLGDSYRPKYVAEYFDPLPAPLVNVRIEPDEKGFVPTLKWDAPSDSDLWFGEIHISDEPIKHKYHNAFLYLPLSHVGNRTHILTREGTISRPQSSGNIYILYYNFMFGNSNVAAIHRGLDVSRYDSWDDCSSSFTAAFTAGNPYIYMDPEGLAGPRVATWKTNNAGNSELPTLDSGFSAYSGGTVIKAVPTNNLSWQYKYSSDPTLYNWKINKKRNFDTEGNINELMSVDELWPDTTFDNTSATAPDESWAVTDAMREELQNSFSISTILYPLAWATPEYVLADSASGGTPVTINNTSSPVTIGSDSSIDLSATVSNNTYGANDVRFITSSSTTAQKKGRLHDCLVKVPITNGHANNYDVGHAYVYHEVRQQLSDTAEITVKDYSGSPELYDTGATEGGGGGSGIATHGENVTVVPRNIIWRMGVINTSTTAVKMGGSDEKLICYLDSSGHVNFWMKVLNQTKWLRLRSLSSLPKDGTTPTHLAVTFDKDLPKANLKLYINGKLEAFTGDRIATGTTTNLQNDANGKGGEPWDCLSHDLQVDLLGRSVDYKGNVTIDGGSPTQNSAEGFCGYVEEFIMLPHEVIYFNPASTEAALEKPFSELSDTSDGVSKTHYAKMFIYDYHNIRGRTKDEVQQTNNISWRKTAFALDMS